MTLNHPPTDSLLKYALDCHERLVLPVALKVANAWWLVSPRLKWPIEITKPLFKPDFVGHPIWSANGIVLQRVPIKRNYRPKTTVCKN
jgi:hypothetical protein